MATHTFWKGYLKLSLVTCPVTMMPATTDNEKVRFHTLNRKTGNRVVSEYIDSVSGKTVDDDEQVKGYQRGEDEYIILEDEELQAIGLESTRTINIDMFVPHGSLEWIWLDKPHYLLPDDPVGEEAFSVIRDAMAATKTVGISRLVLYRRERAVMLEPRDRGIVVWTLRYGDEVRNEQDYFDAVKSRKIEAKSLGLMTELIKERTRSWDASLLSDPVQERLLDIISARKKGRKKYPKAQAEPQQASNVVNIMDALKKSLASESKGSKKR
ncbi:MULTISPECIES: non-homologous end joining protein Ku [Phyllobacterium]|jgi:DNA end-binding protein Ku|uniref:non-homologous end joining protein Ku n=1 Tax=Phyllobacterium TaxID=28100 RepID=UPI001CBF620A|nr:Ku protein [Phyllobacterium calauticae]MBZ3695419.1 Ku protein [Phyllobacterium calauticae]